MGGCWSCKSDGRPRSAYVPSSHLEPAGRIVPPRAPAPAPSSPDNYVRRVPVPVVQPLPRVYTVPKPAVVRVPEPPASAKEKLGPLYGEFKCGNCKSFWTSRLSWPNRYQQCRRCKSYVRPRNQRELRPTDYTNGSEHPKEFCEMCKQLGKHCGSYKP